VNKGLLTILSGNFVLLISYMIRLVILYFLITNNQVCDTKHNKFGSGEGLNDDFLDGRV
jgi:hypothetical protein